MKILIFGNLASGKSYLAEKIQKAIPDLEYLSIDNFRRQFGNGTMEKELLAKQKFLDNINLDKSQLIEATGLGDTGEVIAKKLQQTKEFKFIIILKIPLRISLIRLKNRTWDIPYPAPPEQAFELAETSHKIIKDNFIQILWNGAINYIIMEVEDLSACQVRKIICEIKRGYNDAAN